MAPLLTGKKAFLGSHGRAAMGNSEDRARVDLLLPGKPESEMMGTQTVQKKEERKQKAKLQLDLMLSFQA